MPDETNRIAEDYAAPGSAVRQFHIGNTPQIVPPDLNTAEEQSLEARSTLLKVPSPRPPFGVDDEGNPRPDPTLAPAAAESRSSRTGPAPVPDSKPAADPKADPKR
jgi:hypothetical protein